jgi:hypothetical protein
MYIDLHVKSLLFLSDFNDTLIFSTDVRKMLKIPNFMKVCPVGAELFHTDGQTDMMKLIVAFRNMRTPLINEFDYVCTGMRRITTFRSTTNRIYDSSHIRF